MKYLSYKIHLGGVEGVEGLGAQIACGKFLVSPDFDAQSLFGDYFSGEVVRFVRLSIYT